MATRDDINELRHSIDELEARLMATAEQAEKAEYLSEALQLVGRLLRELYDDPSDEIAEDFDRLDQLAHLSM